MRSHLITNESCSQYLDTTKHFEAKSQNLQPRIRVGLLLDDRLAPRWVHETIERLLCAESVELVAIILDSKPRASRLPPRFSLFSLWRKFDKWVFCQDNDPLAPEVKAHPVRTITLTAVEGMGKRALPPSDLVRIRNYKFDVLVHLGSGDFPEGILSCANYGVWDFHYGGHNAAEGDVALFWNLNSNLFMYELVLRATTETPRLERVLCRRLFPRHLFSLEYNLALDCRRRAQILLQRLSDLYRNGWISVVIEDRDTNPVDERIDCPSLSRMTALWLVRSLRRLLERARCREQWAFAYSNTYAGADIEPTASVPLTLVAPPKGQNYADPFLFEHRGRTYIFFEECSDEGAGSICCTELHADGTLGEMHRVLTRNYHLSYPFVFEWHGDVYLLPESMENHAVEVYRAVDFPLRWELAAVLLSDVSAVDSTILEHNGKLWLFAAGLGGLGTEWSELSLFFADSLFGEWRPHPKNPIVRDARRARPAGRLFFRNESLIRPGQNCSVCYGYAISFNRVDILSETDYRETPLTTFLPNWMPGLSGTHTFNQQSGIRVLDGRVLVPRWRARPAHARCISGRISVPRPDHRASHSVSGRV